MKQCLTSSKAEPIVRSPACIICQTAVNVGWLKKSIQHICSLLLLVVMCCHSMLQSLDRKQALHWVIKNRLSMFLRSTYYAEYRLAKLLSAVNPITDTSTTMGMVQSQVRKAVFKIWQTSTVALFSLTSSTREVLGSYTPFFMGNPKICFFILLLSLLTNLGRLILILILARSYYHCYYVQILLLANSAWVSGAKYHFISNPSQA